MWLFFKIGKMVLKVRVIYLCRKIKTASKYQRCYVTILQYSLKQLISKIYLQSYIEYYNITQDPQQLINLGYTMKSGKRHKFRRRLKKLLECKDENCIFVGAKES